MLNESEFHEHPDRDLEGVSVRHIDVTELVTGIIKNIVLFPFIGWAKCQTVSPEEIHRLGGRDFRLDQSLRVRLRG